MAEIMKVCMEHPGMWDDFMQSGQIDATGEFLEIGRGRFDGINAKYFKGGLGSLLHEVFAPAAAFLDKALGTELADCGGCGERELKINDATGS